MSNETGSIRGAVSELRNNLSEIARVNEWAEHMGYHNPKKFSRFFLRTHGVRPQKVINYVRIKSIVMHLRDGETRANFDIAQLHSIPDEKALNNFTKYHTGLCPKEIKSAPSERIQKALEKVGSKFIE